MQRVNFERRGKEIVGQCREAQGAASGGCGTPLERDDERAEHVKEWLPPCTGQHPMPCAGRVRLGTSRLLRKQYRCDRRSGPRVLENHTHCAPENSCVGPWCGLCTVQ